MGRKLLFQTSLAALSEHLQSRDKHEKWCLEHFQRLNIAGHDFKGQMSTAYGQTGAKGSVDLSTPPVVLGPMMSLRASLGQSTAYTSHSLVMLYRGQSQVWSRHYDRPYQPDTAKLPSGGQDRFFAKMQRNAAKRKFQPIWKTSRPLMLAHLQGKMWEQEGRLAVNAYAGLGSAFSNDEAGFAIGAKLQGSAKYVHTELEDSTAGHYSSAYDGGLADDVVLLLEQNIKGKVVAWLAVAAGGPKLLQSLGVPFRPPVRLDDNDDEFDLDRNTRTALQHWEDHDASDAAQHPGGFKNWLQRKLVDLKVAAISFLKTKGKSTEKLAGYLSEAIDAFESFVEREKTQDGRNADTAKMAANAQKRAAEARELLHVLAQVKVEKNLRKAAKGKELVSRKDGSKMKARLFIDITEGVVKGAAGAQVTVPDIPKFWKADFWKDKSKPVDARDKPAKKKPWTAKLKLDGFGYSKRIAYRFQAEMPGDPGHDRKLITIQDTSLEHTQLKGGFEHGAGRSTKTEVEEEDAYILKTAHYRSVTVNLFNDKKTLGQKALPNGSGISFGMSILVPRLINYALEIAHLDAAGGGALDPEVQEVEDRIIKQLRVDSEELRKFVRRLPDLLYEETQFGNAFVVESAFAFTKAIDLDLSDDDRLKNLLDLDDAKALHEGRKPKDAKLQSIRLRYRFGGDADRSMGMSSFGLTPAKVTRYWQTAKNKWDQAERVGDALAQSKGDLVEAYEETKHIVSDKKYELEAPAVKFGVSFRLDRVNRVGHEGILVVHEQFFPERYDTKTYGEDEARRLADRNYQANAEYLVPPVQLFSQ